MPAILRTALLSRFVCLGERCEDTCCQGWSMQVDGNTIERYNVQAPELLAAVEPATDGTAIMRKDKSGLCVKLEDGLCGIHKRYGPSWLGDACYFYPRVTRRLGPLTLMTATLSCPEIARLALFDAAADDAPWDWQPATVERLPQTMRDYLPEDLEAKEALAVHAAFLAASQDSQLSAEHAFLRIANAARSLMRIDKARWPAMAAFYLSHADSRLPQPETNINDPFNLLHALAGLAAAGGRPPSPRLRQTLAEMEQALAVTLRWEDLRLETSEDSLANYQRMAARWEAEWKSFYAPLLRRWLAMQLSLLFFPFSAPGDDLARRLTILGVRLATFKLALLCGSSVYGGPLPQEMALRVAQSLARFLDHAGDTAFLARIYQETGWDQESRLRALLEK